MQPGEVGAWYGWDGTTQHGPLALEELRRRVAAGQLPPHTQVKQGPNGAWGPMPAGSAGGPHAPPLQVGPAPGYSGVPAELSPDVGRAVVVGALTGLGVVVASGVPLLVRYAASPGLTNELLGNEPKWRVGLVIAAAVVARILASGPRRDVHALVAAVLAAWIVGGGAMAISVAVIVQLRPLHGLLASLPAFFFCWALATRGLDFDGPSHAMHVLSAALPVLLWLGGALGAGAIARRFAPVS